MALVPATGSIRDGISRVILLLAATVLLVLVVACGSDEKVNTSGQSATAAPSATKAAAFPSLPAATFATCPATTGTPPEVQMKSYPQRPPLTIDKTHQYIAHVYTTRGHFIIQLLPDLAP